MVYDVVFGDGPDLSSRCHQWCPLSRLLLLLVLFVVAVVAAAVVVVVVVVVVVGVRRGAKI